MAGSPNPNPVTPRPAATMVLLRQGAAQELEVLLMQRPLTMRFMPGYWAFPGGALSQIDKHPGVISRVVDAPSVSEAPDRLAHLVASVRELFEETGVLLARPCNGRCLPEDLTDWRQRIRQEPAAFPAFLQEYDLHISADQLRYLHRWVTPVSRPIRFDTFFFVAILPPGQRVNPFTDEVADTAWRKPSEVLAVGQEASQLATATWDSLNKLATYGSIPKVLAELPPALRIVEDRLWNEPPNIRRL